MPPTKFGLSPTYRSEQTLFEVFQDGHCAVRLEYWNETILAILNRYFATMPLIKFKLNLTYGLGRDVV